MSIWQIFGAIYILIVAASVIVAIALWDVSYVILGIALLLGTYTLGSILLANYDESLKAPEPVVKISSGDATYRVMVSRYVYGFQRFFIMSGDSDIAILYRDSAIEISAPDDEPVSVTRKYQYNGLTEMVPLKKDCVNYVWVEHTPDRDLLRVDLYRDAGTIDDAKYETEYLNAKQDAVDSHHSSLIWLIGSTVTLAVAALGIMN